MSQATDPMNAVPPVLPPASPGDPFMQIVARLQSAQKSNRGASGYARWVNRPLGRYLAAAAFKTGRTPNQVTLVSAAFTFAAMALTATVRPTLVLGILIAAMLLVGFALDAADGQLARLRGGGSAAGEWLDHVVDAAKCTGIHLVILISWYRFFGLSSAWLLIPIAYTLQSSVFYFTIMLTEQLSRSARGVTSSSKPWTNEPAPVLRSILVLPNDYGVLALAFVLLAFHTGFLWVYSLLLMANVVFLLGGLVNWYRRMQALSRPSPSAPA